MLASRLLPAVLAALALSTVACGRVHVDNARGPDGSNEWKSISCRHMDKRCFRTAEQLCPNGYYFARGAGAIAPPAEADEVASEDGPVSHDPRASAPSPRAGVNAKTLPPQERWGSGMYTRRGGTILVQCADVRTTASR
jgi:hypothetical protein